MKCNYDCFNCIYDDCINDKLTKVEKMESAQRDNNFIRNGKVIINGHSNRAKNKYNKNRR